MAVVQMAGQHLGGSESRGERPEARHSRRGSPGLGQPPPTLWARLPILLSPPEKVTQSARKAPWSPGSVLSPGARWPSRWHCHVGRAGTGTGSDSRAPNCPPNEGPCLEQNRATLGPRGHDSACWSAAAPWTDPARPTSSSSLRLCVSLGDQPQDRSGEQGAGDRQLWQGLGLGSAGPRGRDAPHLVLADVPSFACGNLLPGLSSPRLTGGCYSLGWVLEDSGSFAGQN